MHINTDAWTCFVDFTRVAQDPAWSAVPVFWLHAHINAHAHRHTHLQIKSWYLKSGWHEWRSKYRIKLRGHKERTCTRRVKITKSLNVTGLTHSRTNTPVSARAYQRITSSSSAKTASAFIGVTVVSIKHSTCKVVNYEYCRHSTREVVNHCLLIYPEPGTLI